MTLLRLKAASGVARLSLIRRLRYAWMFREWPWRIPVSVDLIGTERPPEAVFEEFRRIHGLPDPRQERDA